ncbi:hypothetical protein BDW69DRAFT_184361 [Aspergillus filifer]
MSTTHIPGLLQPVVALNGWTFVMKIWIQTNSIICALETRNFNHLFEQPNRFYVVVLALAIARQGKTNSTNLKLAWA